jgi:hypothetical protein
MIKKQSEIKAYFEAFAGQFGIGTVKVGNYLGVTDDMLTRLEYPLLWVNFPPTRKGFFKGSSKNRWRFDIVIVNTAQTDDVERQELNFGEMADIAEKIFMKMQSDADDSQLFEFDEETDVDEWQPKEYYSADSNNGWFIPLSIATMSCRNCGNC